MTNLKPCPFCGTAPRLSGEPGFKSVSCPGCWAEGPWAVGTETHQAIEKWNQRASTVDPPDLTSLEDVMRSIERSRCTQCQSPLDIVPGELPCPECGAKQ